jgi:hypothetical protein
LITVIGLMSLTWAGHCGLAFAFSATQSVLPKVTARPVNPYRSHIGAMLNVAPFLRCNLCHGFGRHADPPTRWQITGFRLIIKHLIKAATVTTTRIESAGRRVCLMWSAIPHVRHWLPCRQPPRLLTSTSHQLDSLQGKAFRQ